MSHYDLTEISQLIEFDKDCARAASGCPQQDYIANTRSIKSKKYNAVEIFESWRNAEILWKSGYYVELSKQAMETFLFIREHGLLLIR